jgi:hypothetical protein
MNKYFNKKNLISNAVLLEDEQVTVASTDDGLQRAVHSLKNTAIKYNLNI